MQIFHKLLQLKGPNNYGQHLCKQVFSSRQCRNSALTRLYEAAKFPISKVMTEPRLGRTTSDGSGTGLSRQFSPVQSSSSSSGSTSLGSLNSSPGQAPSTITSMTSQSSTINLHSAQKFILFGVNGKRRTLDIEHIDTLDHCNDVKFFHRIVSSYNAYRGRLRRWFSIWQLQ
jgi:hypothetical protein